MFGKTQNGVGTKAAAMNPSGGSSATRQRAGEAERLIEQLPNRYEIRAWTFEHPWLAVGSGMAAGYFATRIWSAAARSSTKAPGRPAAKPFADPRGLRRASAALWLIPLFEITRIGLETANAYRQRSAERELTE